MPRVSTLITPDDSPSISDATTRNPESIQLFMPSNIEQAERDQYCDVELIEMECKIRYASAVDALQDLRRQLHFRVYMNQLKIKNVTGQRPNTRARSMQKSIEGRVREAADRYRRARKAYVALAGTAADSKLRELKPEHVVGLGERLQREIEEREIAATWEKRGHSRPTKPQAAAGGGTSAGQSVEPQVTSGESKRKISWLWYSGGLEDENEAGEENEAITGEENEATLTGDMNDGQCIESPLHFYDANMHCFSGVRVEWLKARARAQRWEEEVRLLREEMERVLRTFSFMATWWEGQTGRMDVEMESSYGAQTMVVDDTLREGLLAYAAEQADMYRGLRTSFEGKWVRARAQAGVFLSRQSVLDG